MATRPDPLTVLCIASAVCGLLARALPDGQLQLGLLVAFALLAPGAAVLVHVGPVTGYLVVPLVLLISLTLSALLPSLMLWTGWWHPGVELGVLAAACLLSGLAALPRRPVR